jgi:hypothetical protein
MRMSYLAKDLKRKSHICKHYKMLTAGTSLFECRCTDMNFVR